MRELPWHHPEQLSADDYYYRYRLDPHAATIERGNFVKQCRGFERIMTWLEPGVELTRTFEVAPGDWLIVFDFLDHKLCYAHAVKEPGDEPAKLRVEHGDDGWSGLPPEIPHGKIEMTLLHKGAGRCGAYIFAHEEHPPLTLSLGNFLSGNRLLNNQTYRNLFRVDTLASGEGIGVRDLTLLFTDLKGSTELYERVGDLAAFALVQQHFEHLRRAVQEQQGAIIKTIGDAVMASFTRPDQAVRAAIAMFAEIEEFNRNRGARDLTIKVGLHRGHSIAVTLNERLDYFGQTVNMAARVQGLANADEICLTEDAFREPAVQEALKDHTATPEQAQLKGIQGSVPIRRVRIG